MRPEQGRRRGPSGHVADDCGDRLPARQRRAGNGRAARPPPGPPRLLRIPPGDAEQASRGSRPAARDILYAFRHTTCFPITVQHSREPGKRPVAAVADQKEVREVADVRIVASQEKELTLLFDPGFSLEERIFAEQFQV